MNELLLPTVSKRYSQGDGPTAYQDFLAWMDQKTDIVKETAVGSGTPAATSGYRRVTFSASGTPMWGTCWGNKFTYDSRWSCILRHAVDNEAIYNDIIANKRQVLFKITYIGNGASYVSLTRNGYVSSAYGPYNGCTLSECIYYDFQLGRIMRTQPLAAVGGQPFALS